MGEWGKTSHVHIHADQKFSLHRYECILAAHEAFSSHGPYDLRLYRLERVDEDIKVVAYDQESLEVSLEEHWEIR